MFLEICKSRIKCSTTFPNPSPVPMWILTKFTLFQFLCYKHGSCIRSIRQNGETEDFVRPKAIKFVIQITTLKNCTIKAILLLTRAPLLRYYKRNCAFYDSIKTMQVKPIIYSSKLIFLNN